LDKLFPSARVDSFQQLDMSCEAAKEILASMPLKQLEHECLLGLRAISNPELTHESSG
jgi:hypothetical protein